MRFSQTFSFEQAVQNWTNAQSLSSGELRGFEATNNNNAFDPNAINSFFRGPSQFGRTPSPVPSHVQKMFTMIDQHDLPGLQLLFQQGGLDFSSEDQDDDSLLHRAILVHDHQIAKFLLNSGHPINPAGCSARTPIVLAACERDPQMIKILCEEGKQLPALALTDSLEETAIHKVAAWGDPEMFSLLLDYLCDEVANFQNVLGRTALHNAAESGNLTIAKQLVDYVWCKPNIVDYFDYTAFDVALYSRRGPVAELLYNMMNH